MDIETEVPLDREEELSRTTDPSRLRRADAKTDVVDLLFRTRLMELSPKPPISVSIGATVAEACARMREHKIGCVLVMDGAQIAGIFTERDVLYKVTCADRDLCEMGIRELMTPNPTTLRAGHRLAHALNKMSADGCRHVPIVDDEGVPLGVVSVRRIADFLVEQFPAALLNLPPDLDQSMDSPEGG